MTTTLDTPTTDERIAARLAALTQQRAERQDELDLPRSMSQRQVNEYVAATARLDRQIVELRSAADTLATLSSAEPDLAWQTHLTEWRATICSELLAIKSPIRDREIKELADKLSFSIRLIDFGFGVSLRPIVTLAPTRVGELMSAAGYAVDGSALSGPLGWRGSQKEVAQHIKNLTAQRTSAQATVDALLLTDDERATRDAESAELRSTLNSMRIRCSQDGLSLVAYTHDGDVLDVADMTPAQRTAFENADAVHRQERQATTERHVGRR